MLFNYRYVPHSIETFQAWMDHLVKNVWCRNDGTAYSIELLINDLKDVVVEIGNDDSIQKDHLDGPIKAIDAIMQTDLSAAQRIQMAEWYDSNNDIEALYTNDTQKEPVTYDELKTINADLEKELKSFFKSLFASVIHLKAVQSRIGHIDDHYKEFVKENNEGKCPYCGINDIKGEHHTKREAYDHFLPKGTYPFNSVNFRNLAPMCHECNSTYKLQKDPTLHIDPLNRGASGTRRKAFYSFSKTEPKISIELTLNTSNSSELSPEVIDLRATSPGCDEEVEGWQEVYGIEERYKAKCCGENDGKAWLQRVIEERINYDLTEGQMLAAELKAAANKPWSDSNFLKKPFLESCVDAGILAE